MSATPTLPQPDEMANVQQLLEHFEKLEDQMQKVSEGLAHSHRLATLGTITSIIAHEYNNILTPIVSYCQSALARTDDGDLLIKAVQKSLAGAERAAHISSSLLDFAREQDEQHAASLSKTIEESLTCLARHPKKDGIALSVDVPDVQIAIEPLNLQQVLVNLILNAKKAMRQSGGQLKIAARVQGTKVHIEVADSGPGIADEVQNRLFEPFVSHRHGPEEDPGEHKATGLGLCICRDLIRQAGGSIQVESSPGAGATFHIILPRADDLFKTT